MNKQHSNSLFNCHSQFQSNLDLNQPDIETEDNNPNLDTFSQRFNQINKQSFISELELEDILRKPKEFELLNNSLIAMFFSTNLTQSSFKTVIELFEIITNQKLPNTFDKLNKNLGGLAKDSFSYEKEYYCPSCKKIVVKNSSNQRRCQMCDTRYFPQFFKRVNVIYTLVFSTATTVPNQPIVHSMCVNRYTL